MMNNQPIIGVLALQGAVEPHRKHIEAAGLEFRAVKTPKQFDEVNGFILPGGESTTMLKLIDRFELWDSLIANFKAKPVWGICAGSILMAEKVFYYSSCLRSERSEDLNGGDPDKTIGKADRHVDPVRAGAPNGTRQRDDGEWVEQKSFGLIPMTVQRNGYGRQIDSHHDEIEGYPVSLIRAPVITDVKEGVYIVAEHQDTPVWLEYDQYMVTTFHPELTLDFPSPMHRKFVDMVKSHKTKKAA